MLMQHKSHEQDQWYEVLDSDMDCDFITGQYIGLTNRVKLSDGKWYAENECNYTDDGMTVKSVA